MSKPLVSVVMPAYNCAGTIRQAIDSVKKQKMDLEIIIINDCSKDELDTVMEAYRDDPVIFYVKNEKNIGAAASRNRGVAMARAPFVAFLDTDDWWAEDKLKKQMDKLKKTGCVLCCTARELVTPDGQLTGRVISVKERLTYRSLLTHNSINCSSVLARTEVLRKFPMEYEQAHEDYVTWLKILQKYKTACAVNEPLLKYRLTSTGKSGNKLVSAKKTFQVYRYMGFGLLKSAVCFCSYALHGVLKYGGSVISGRIGSHKSGQND